MKRAKRLSRIASALVISALALSAVGCGDKQAESAESQSEAGFVISSDVTRAITEWSMSDFLSDISIYGRRINLSGAPIDIGSDFIIVNSSYNDTFGVTTCDVTYNGGKVGTLIIDGNEENSLYGTIVSASFDNLSGYAPEDFTVKGVKGGSSTAWVKEMLGEPNLDVEVKDPSVFTYVFPQDGEITMSFDYQGKLECVQIAFKQK